MCLPPWAVVELLEVMIYKKHLEEAALVLLFVSLHSLSPEADPPCGPCHWCPLQSEEGTDGRSEDRRGEQGKASAPLPSVACSMMLLWPWLPAPQLSLLDGPESTEDACGRGR